MKKLRSEALNKFLQNEKRALIILVSVPTAIIVVGGIASMLAVAFMR
jgi:hypothetical protein